MTLRYLSFTGRGDALARRLAASLPGPAARCGADVSLQDWTAAAFAEAEGLVFVGAAGIAVRAVAPFVRSKAADPAVVVVDEQGRFAVPLLSGHLGGANDLARAIGRACGAVPVITTATDGAGAFAVDEWAKRQNCAICQVERIKDVSARILAGETVTVSSPWPIAGPCPPLVRQGGGEPCQVRLDVRAASGDALHLAPRILTLGIGCRRGTSQAALEAALAKLLVESGVVLEAVAAAASIGLKENEPGLLAFCASHGWPCTFYSAAELAGVAGEFSASPFVEAVTGVDNVCERSAVLCSGGQLYWKKTVLDGVTLALAQKPYRPDWRWRGDGA